MDESLAVSKERCAELLYEAMIDIRNSSYESGNEQRVYALADILHNVPRGMVGRDPHGADFLQTAFAEFHRTHGRGERYLRILELTEAEFEAETAPRDWPWPEPAAVTV